MVRPKLHSQKIKLNLAMGSPPLRLARRSEHMLDKHSIMVQEPTRQLLQPRHRQSEARMAAHNQPDMGSHNNRPSRGTDNQDMDNKATSNQHTVTRLHSQQLSNPNMASLRMTLKAATKLQHLVIRLQVGSQMSPA